MSLDSSYEMYALPKLEDSIQKNLPQHLRKILDRKLKYLSKNPFYPSLNTKKYDVSQKMLKILEVDEVWEFYINRHEYRCIFYVIHGEKKIIVAFVGNHDKIERRYSSR